LSVLTNFHAFSERLGSIFAFLEDVDQQDEALLAEQPTAPTYPGRARLESASPPQSSPPRGSQRRSDRNPAAELPGKAVSAAAGGNAQRARDVYGGVKAKMFALKEDLAAKDAELAAADAKLGEMEVRFGEEKRLILEEEYRAREVALTLYHAV